MAEEKEKEKAAGTISRRDFIRDAGLVVGGAVVGAAAGAGITAVVAPTKEVVKEVPVTKEVGVPTTGVVEPAFEPEETVLKCYGFSGTSHAEPAAVDVKNGKIVRVRPLHYDSKYTKEELASAWWKIEARGKTFEPVYKSLIGYFFYGYKKRVYSPNRIVYPLKRVDWEPGGDPAKINPQNRGKSKFKRISWDEATTIIANEIKRIGTKYGPRGVMCMGDGHGENKTVHGNHGKHKELLKQVGGYTDTMRNPDSWEGWVWGASHVWGQGDNGFASPGAGMYYPQGCPLSDIAKNTEMIVNTGGDVETTAVGFAGHFQSRIFYWLTELGIKQVYVCPELNYQAAVHADKWIPVLPNTDPALQLGVIYTWIKEDTYDKDYVATHTVGFDKVKAYVMGDEDGVPKTPAWASAICGVPEWTIKALARTWAKKKTCTQHYFGSPMARGPYSHEPARLECIQLGMQGLGKPGRHQFYYTSMAPPAPVVMASAMAAAASTTVRPPTVIDQVIWKTQFSDAILKPPLTNWAPSTTPEGQTKKAQYPIPAAQGGTEVHMLWIDNPCWTVCWNDGYRIIEAFRSPKVETIVVEHMWLEDDCLYGDLILPVSTMFELDDFYATRQANEQLHMIYLSQPACKPLGESMSDYQLCCEVAKKLGTNYEGKPVFDAYTGGKTVAEWIKYGYEKSGVADKITWEKLNEKGYYIVPLNPDWDKQPKQLEKFAQDPIANPLATPSGKMEFYSQRLADAFPDDNERGPLPKWVPGGPGFTHDESLQGARAKKYPLLLITNHPRWRFHPQDDDVPWLREIPTCKVKGPDGYLYEPLWIHPTDAAKRGIANGDIVKLYNDRGAVLGGAYVCQRIKPGAVYQDHGARLDLITDDIDRGGSNNLISPHPGSSKHCEGSMAVSGFLVEVEKVSGDQMAEWRKKYPEAFARDYEPSVGLKFNAWVEGGTSQ